jgi:pimeloyl-ACP methyl ester carboxylesterase
MRPTPCRRLVRRSSRPRPPTSTHGPRRRWTRRTPTADPLLIISGEKDHTVPPAIANASYKKQERNEGVTEIVEIPNRGHALTIDSGWREVADTALAFVQRFANAHEPQPAGRAWRQLDKGCQFVTNARPPSYAPPQESSP